MTSFRKLFMAGVTWIKNIKLGEAIELASRTVIGTGISKRLSSLILEINLATSSI